VTGLQSLGDASALPGNVVSDSNQFGDIVTFDHGKHMIKVGFEFQCRRYNIFQAVYPRGQFAFAPYFTRKFDPLTNTFIGGNALAELLLGLPQSTRLDLLNGTRGIRRSEYAVFVQDSWKVAPHLTLNLGLRYDNLGNKTGTEVHNRMAQFLPSTGLVYPVGSPQVPSLSGTERSNLNFAPRLGFAYSPDSKTVVRGSYGMYFASMYVVLSQGLAFNAPFVGSETYSNDYTNVAVARKLSQGFTRQYPINGFGGNVNAVATSLPTPYNSLWDLGFERQLPGSFVLSADYVGSKSTHLQYLNDINTPAPGPGVTAPRRPYPNYNEIFQISTTAYANYNAIQATLARRFTRGLELSESYTYSHCLDIADSGSTADGQIQNPLDSRPDYAGCSWDLRQRSVTTASYALPFGRGQAILKDVGRLTDAFVGGWKLNMITNLYTGFAFTPTNALNTLNSTGITQRPNLTAGCDPVLSGAARSATRWFNPTCYTSPAPYKFGNVGRNSLRGPGTTVLDLSLFKTVNLVPEGRAKAQFQVQAFNITNTPQWNNPNAAIGTTSAGVISSAGSDATFARTARQIQLGIRVDF
jgi:hypothetical protein